MATKKETFESINFKADLLRENIRAALDLLATPSHVNVSVATQDAAIRSINESLKRLRDLEKKVFDRG